MCSRPITGIQKRCKGSKSSRTIKLRFRARHRCHCLPLHCQMLTALRRDLARAAFGVPAPQGSPSKLSQHAPDRDLADNQSRECPNPMSIPSSEIKSCLSLSSGYGNNRLPANVGRCTAGMKCCNHSEVCPLLSINRDLIFKFFIDPLINQILMSLLLELRQARRPLVPELIWCQAVLNAFSNERRSCQDVNVVC